MATHLNRPRARLEATEAHDVPQPNRDPTTLGEVSDRATLSWLQFRARGR
jgi:hypothetical protein